MKEKGLNFCSNLLPIYIIGGLWLVKSGSIIHNLSWFPVQILLDGLKSAEKIELKGSTSSQKRQSTCICIYSLKHTLFYAGATQCDIIFLPPIHNTSVFVFVWSCPCTCIGLFVFCICAHVLHAHPRCNAKLYLCLYLFGQRIAKSLPVMYFFEACVLFSLENVKCWPILALFGYFVANLRTFWCT